MMNVCNNPLCKKEIPDTLKYCSEDCLRQALDTKNVQNKKIKSEENNQTSNLASEETLWLGQDRRKRATETILRLAKELCPLSLKRFACIVSCRTGLSIRKVTDDYLEVLLEIGLLKREDNLLYFNEAKKEETAVEPKN